MIKLLHNRLIVKYFLAVIGIAFAVFYGFCFYAFGDWAGHTFLQDFPAGAQVLGWICFAVMFGLVWISLFSKEYMKQNSHAYSAATGDQSFRLAFTAFTVFIVGMELVSVLFRVILIRFGPLSFVVLLAGLAGMALVFIISKLLHSEVNRPAAVAAAHLRETAARAAFEDGEKVLPELSIGQKRRVAAGSARPIDDVRNAKWQEREDAVAADRKRQQDVDDDLAKRQRIADADKRKNEALYEQMISPADPTPAPLELPSSNGHSKRPANF